MVYIAKFVGNISGIVLGASKTNINLLGWRRLSIKFFRVNYCRKLAQVTTEILKTKTQSEKYNHSLIFGCNVFGCFVHCSQRLQKSSHEKSLTVIKTITHLKTKDLKQTLKPHHTILK